MPNCLSLDKRALTLDTPMPSGRGFRAAFHRLDGCRPGMKRASGPAMLTTLEKSLRIAALVLAAATSASGQALPSPWQNDDIGAVGVAGWATFDAGTFTVHGLSLIHI